jgi:DNA (cytosine-5)-methyltransferase 1
MKEQGVPSVLDIFAAPGGLSEGFRQAGYSIAAQIDFDQWGCETLRKNFANDGTIVIEGDLKNISISGHVDVVIGGPPCQSFSMVGRPKIAHLRRNGYAKTYDERNRLYKEFVKTVKSMDPQFFVMENVPGILSYKNGSIVREITGEFQKAGYAVDYQTMNAADFGVPQVRKRVFFVGNKIGVKNPFPSRSHMDISKDQLSLFESSGNLRRYVTLVEAISDLPELQAGEGSDEIDYALFRSLSDYQTQMRFGSKRLVNHKARNHSERDKKLFRRLREGEKMSDLPKKLRPYNDKIFLDKIKKQRWDRPSSAILAHMQKDCLMYVHPDTRQARTFTPREAARIQSFPDRYRFMGPMTQQFRQIGNAVPPLLARMIALTIKPLLQRSNAPMVSYNLLTA